MKSIAVHYKNKYPGSNVECSDDRLDVYRGDEHLLALRKNGAGQLVDVSQELGLPERHDMAPLPKDACCYKVNKHGHIVKDEEFSKREKAREQFMDDTERVMSCDELEYEYVGSEKMRRENGFVFNPDRTVSKAAVKKSAEA